VSFEENEEADKEFVFIFEAVLEHRRLAAALSQRRLRFDSRRVRTGFVVDKVALGQVFSEHFSFLQSL
jgi:hypothetical protein